MNLDDEFENEFWNSVDERSKNKGFTLFHFMRYAAVGLLLVGLGYVVTLIATGNKNQTADEVVEVEIVEDTYDSPEMAFEEAKKALMMASGKLNKGQEKIKEIKRFHDAKVTVMGAAEKK